MLLLFRTSRIASSPQHFAFGPRRKQDLGADGDFIQSLLRIERFLFGKHYRTIEYGSGRHKKRMGPATAVKNYRCSSLLLYIPTMHAYFGVLVVIMIPKSQYPNGPFHYADVTSE